MTGTAAVDPARRLPWYGPEMSPASSVTARLMETWAHGQDVVDTLGVERPATNRLRHVAHLGVRALPYSYSVRRLRQPTEPIRVELAAPEGGSQWSWGPADAVNRVTGEALDFCLVVTQRRHTLDTALVVTGPTAQQWISIAQAFAGPAGPGRPPQPAGPEPFERHRAVERSSRGRVMPAAVQSPEPARRRDPRRRQRILTAAAELVAERGYHDVGMSDIGAAAGVTGSAIYRHFDGKSAVLVTLFDRVIDDLSREASEIVSSRQEPLSMLRELIESHVRIVIVDRALMRVYHSEITNLPTDDSQRLRRKQRLYVEEWVHILAQLRPKVGDATLRALVHASIGAIQSTLFYESGLSGDRLAILMTAMAESVLLAPDPGSQTPLLAAP